LTYNPETGEFIWKTKRNTRSKNGRVAGSYETTGYVRIRIDGVRFFAHRLAWFYVHREWPTDLIDHRNGCRSDNRIINLRPTNATENNQNLLYATSRSKSGFLGTWVDKKRWGASIKLNGKSIYLGTYETPEIAHGIYVAAKRHLHAGGTL
jgi:hypothetical protein